MSEAITWLLHLACIYIVINQGYSQRDACCIQCNSTDTKVSRNKWTVISTDKSLNPFSYPANTTCDFSLSPQYPPDILHIKTSRFYLEESIGCHEEYIEILTENYPLTSGNWISLGRWCGQSFAKSLYIKGPVMIRYKAGIETSLDFTIEVTAHEGSYFGKELRETILVGQAPMYIYSLGYPSSYINNLKMSWTLQPQDVLQQVNVEAVEFSLEPTGDTGRCQFDNLTLKSEAHEAVWCGSTGQRFFSGKSYVLATLRTDRTKDNTGFLLRVYSTYIQNTHCNGSRIRLLPAHHTAELLSLTDGENRMMECSWIIQAQTQDEVIVLETVSWDSDVLSCDDTPFKIFDGSDDKGSPLVTSCGGVRPFGFVRTSGNSAYISSQLKVLSRNKIKKGFRIKYYSTHKYFFEEYHKEAVTARSFVWVPSMGTDVQRPVINVRADVAERCVNVEAQDKWRHEIQMSYTELVDVYDGTNERARLIGVCSIHDSADISGTGSTLRIKVKTPVENGGFWLVIDTTQNCNGDTEILFVTNAAQRLTFPTSRMKLNNNFPSNTNCRWELRTDGSRGLTHLEVSGVFLSHSSTCANNYLMASSDNDQTQEVMTWCNSRQGNVTSLGGFFLMVVIDNFLSERSFNARFWRESGFSCESKRLYASSEWNYLSSPGYPANYPNNANCSWVISSRHSTDNVKLEIIHIDTHSCDHDVINVYEGTTTNHLRREMCGPGYSMSTLQSFGSSLYITFKADSTITHTGFKLAYYSVHPSGDNSSVVAYTATPDVSRFDSPNYPYSYQRNVRRFWVIGGDNSNDVVTIQRAPTYGSTKKPCRNRHDTLAVYDGTSERDALLGYFCRADLPLDAPLVFQSSGQFVYLSLFSSDSFVESGYSGTFSIIYSSGSAQRACLPGGIESLEAKEYWQYLKYPIRGEYPKHAHCEWRLWTDNSTVVVEVTLSNLEESYSCKYDAVRVYDGYSTLSPETGVFCGRQTPTFHSTGRYLFLLFVSDDMNQGNGFSLRYRIKPDEEEPPVDQKPNGLLIGATTSGVFLLIVAVTCFFCILGKYRRKPPQPARRDPPPYSRSNSTVYVVSPIIVGGSTASDPPPYPGVTNPAYSMDDLPPAYPGIAHAQPIGPPPRAPPGGNEHTYDEVFSDVAGNLPPPPPYSVLDTTQQETPPAYHTVVSQANKSETNIRNDPGAQMHQHPRSRSDQGENGRGSTPSPRPHALTIELLGPV
ncbi:cubilin-like [Haliotis rubra]|uniref:cubilin-like n=1 Tax=Haliotis rubra TaxID=36100 RepID=UPI001EE5EEE1|nr:cubilin-like [Haliotis rubra]